MKFTPTVFLGISSLVSAEMISQGGTVWLTQRNPRRDFLLQKDEHRFVFHAQALGDARLSVEQVLTSRGIC